LGQSEFVKYWEIIADRLHARGWSYGIAEHLTALLRRWMPLVCFQDSRFCKTNLVLNRMVLCARPATFGADKSFRRKEIERTALRAPLMLSDRDCRRFNLDNI